jgi:hypothetical protein
MHQLHWSGTAVDDIFVYFVGVGVNDIPNLERVNKSDGGGREVLLANVTSIMEPVNLMVDSNYVYIAGNGQLARVPISGGKLEPIVMFSNISDASVVAQDDECVYFADGAALTCAPKSGGPQTLLLMLAAGRFAQLATSAGDLYVGVDPSWPAHDQPKQNWVGVLTCDQVPVAN